MKNKTKKTILAVTILTIALIIQQALSASSQGSDTNWIIEGDCVRWNNTKGDINLCPHTLTQSGWVNVDITSHLATTQDLTFAFGITEGLSVSKPQAFTNINHQYTVSNCTRRTVEIINNGTPQNEEQTVCNPYVADNYYDDWQSVGGFYQTTHNGRTWHQRDATWEPGETKTVRAWVEVAPRSGRNKYHIFLKRASDTISEAISSGNYVLLDPWVDSPPTIFNETFDNGEFVNASLTSLNISRGWLILNITGANQTEILLNTSAVEGQNCWNSSADPAYSSTAYNCANLIDAPADPFVPTNIWAAVGTSVPQWVAYELPDYFWLYNFTYDKGFDTQNGRNPANWSIQVPSRGVTRANPNGPGADNSTDWTFAQFNSTNNAGTAPSKGGFVFGPVRVKWFRFHISNQNAVGNQVYFESIHAYRSNFSTFGNMTSVILNDTVVVDTVSVTCANTTGDSNDVGMNITVMDKNYQNEQTVQCNSDSTEGFVNDVNSITGLIYRVNFSSKHSGVTPELDFLTFRVNEGGTAASESEGDIAIESAINTIIPLATRYKTQKVYVVNASNNQWQGTVDYLVMQNNPPKRWLLNYITAGESYLNATNLSNTVYVLELTNRTTAQITNRVISLLSATKS